MLEGNVYPSSSVRGIVLGGAAGHQFCQTEQFLVVLLDFAEVPPKPHTDIGLRVRGSVA